MPNIFTFISSHMNGFKTKICFQPFFLKFISIPDNSFTTSLAFSFNQLVVAACCGIKGINPESTGYRFTNSGVP